MTGVILAALAALASTLVACGGSENEGTAERAAGAAAPVTAARLAHEPPRGVVEDCATRSEASFPGAFTDPRNVVIGPLVLVGAVYTDPATVVEFGGNKFPLLVRAGHRVTVELSPRTRRVASLGYGPLPQGVELEPRDGHRVVTFIACRRGQPVTFWSGAVVTRTPGCVPLAVWVDDEPAPRRTALRMGPRDC
jgi:hypothetical protein